MAESSHKVAATANFMVKQEDGSEEAQTREIEVEFDFGDDLDSMVVEHTREAVYHHAMGSMRVALQSYLRSLMVAGVSDEEILNEKVPAWSVPTGKARSVNRLEKMEKLLGKMSDDEKATLLAQLQD